MSQRSLPNRAWYAFLSQASRLAGVSLLGLRVWGREHFPATGGALVLGNHQSHFDPVLFGLSSDRRMNFVARQNLFRFAPFRWLILSLDAIPIDREGSGLSGLKETLKRLKRGELVLLFPEGTRTPDGRVRSFKPGFCAVARRSGAAIVPGAVAGAFAAWPRTAQLPRRAAIHLAFGKPFSPAQIAAMGDRDLLAAVESRVRQLHLQLVHHMGRTLSPTV